MLSGRNSYLKRQITPERQDLDDDYRRLEQGIAAARLVTAFRTGKEEAEITLQDIKTYGPPILYNGTPAQNKDLREALQDNKIPHYLAAKFQIYDLPAGEYDTRGQFKHMKTLGLFSGMKKIGIVTHAYHFPRVGRLVKSKHSPFDSDGILFCIPVDPQLTSLHVQEDRDGEIERIPRYIEQGNLTPDIADTVIFRNIFPLF